MDYPIGIDNEFLANKLEAELTAARVAIRGLSQALEDIKRHQKTIGNEYAYTGAYNIANKALTDYEPHIAKAAQK